MKDSRSERTNTSLLESLHLTKPRFMPFWNAPEIRRLRKFIGRAFLLWLAAVWIDYYIHDSGWYPQPREVAVFFNHGDWIQGEIRTCYSILFNGKFFGIDCSPETQEIKRDGVFGYSPENHVLRVRFWGSLKADTNKLWSARGRNRVASRLLSTLQKLIDCSANQPGDRNVLADRDSL